MDETQAKAVALRYAKDVLGIDGQVVQAAFVSAKTVEGMKALVHLEAKAMVDVRERWGITISCQFRGAREMVLVAAYTDTGEAVVRTTL